MNSDLFFYKIGCLICIEYGHYVPGITGLEHMKLLKELHDIKIKQYSLI